MTQFQLLPQTVEVGLREEIKLNYSIDNSPSQTQQSPTLRCLKPSAETFF
ncbi:hypothetical protein QUA84_12950 [Microcoleus sp. F8-C3]